VIFRWFPKNPPPFPIERVLRVRNWVSCSGAAWEMQAEPDEEVERIKRSAEKQEPFRAIRRKRSAPAAPFWFRSRQTTRVDAMIVSSRTT
jgi:hypothetical protein